MTKPKVIILPFGGTKLKLHLSSIYVHDQSVIILPFGGTKLKHDSTHSFVQR